MGFKTFSESVQGLRWTKSRRERRNFSNAHHILNYKLYF